MHSRGAGSCAGQSADFSRDHGLDSSIDQTTVLCGAKQVVFNANFASLDTGATAVRRPTQ
ncbi:hypothetical protein CWO91_15455 [Bradyrhizobium genosp. SA-3]|nr:hypothetical protein CWO91_15455 [Bradyrhizobium genosp. SA-3]